MSIGDFLDRAGNAGQSDFGGSRKTHTAKGKDNGEGRVKQFKSLGEATYSMMSDEARAKFGSMQDTLIFLYTIYDPRHKQGIKSGDTYQEGYQTVGFAFKSTVDIKIPNMPHRCNPQHLQDVEVGLPDVEVKAGEEFYLNSVELGCFLSRPEYLGRASGGDRTVVLSASAGKDATTPLALLKLDSTKGSVKAGGVSLMDCTEDEDGKVRYTVCEKFRAKFGNFAAPSHKQSRGATAKSKIPASAALAVAFGMQTGAYDEFLPSEDGESNR